ncbi:MAG: Na+/H+ antiporter NhaA [Leptolyngbya sp. PLA3]|nr:MAG: Na+/H+ antiporter NhaA [Cyanobacteria bacterium CYA]MCE7967433.1 Na+/H+ antiporter NhaA [Leptolyngbya sp. PL-A3]
MKLEPGERLVRPFQRFAALSSAGGLVLLGFAVLALIWANSPWSASYHGVFHETDLEIGIGGWLLSHHLVHWINDALMAVFFLIVGLEIKREMLVGELADPRKAALPIVAAIGGMIVPAAIYAAINFGQPTLRGWGVPMATDIAFALGVLALLGSRVPLSLKVFLTSLAIVDDLGALVVIALFYTENISMMYIQFGGAALGVLVLFNMFKVRSPIPYVLVGVGLWYCLLESGIHSTIAGVLLAMTIPATGRVNSQRFAEATGHALDVFDDEKMGRCVRTSSTQRAAVQAIATSCAQVMPPLHRIEHALHGWVAFLILPIFALANAGVHVGHGAGEAITGSISLGVIFGLLVGKPAGIVGACWLATKVGVAALPTGANWRQMIGVGMLGGIGFTMALFIATLAFPDAAGLEAAKMGILSGSLLSAVAGGAVLLTCRPAAAAGAASEVHEEVTAMPMSKAA